MFDKGAFVHAVCDCFQGVINGAMCIKRFPSSLAFPCLELFSKSRVYEIVQVCGQARASVAQTSSICLDLGGPDVDRNSTIWWCVQLHKNDKGGHGLVPGGARPFCLDCAACSGQWGGGVCVST